MDIKKILRKEVQQIAPYTPESLFPPELDPATTKLDLNENFNIEPEVIHEIMRSALSEVDLRLYPAPHAKIAVGALSRFHGVGEDSVFVGNGIDGTLEKIARTFIDRNSMVGIIEPTFPMYAYYAQLAGGTRVPIDLTEGFGLDKERVLEACKKGINILFICSPNNPTANQFRKDDVKEILEKFDGLIVLDEAYSEFGKYSMVDLVPKYSNLAILKTFSKLFGMAGVRVGYMIADPEVTGYVKRACPPFDVDALAQALVVSALGRWPYFSSKIERIKEEREWLTARLAEASGVSVYPSDASFLLVRINGHSASEVAESLKKSNILVKVRDDHPLLRNCLRIAIGTRAMNERLVAELERSLARQR